MIKEALKLGPRKVAVKRWIASKCRWKNDKIRQVSEEGACRICI